MKLKLNTPTVQVATVDDIVPFITEGLVFQEYEYETGNNCGIVGDTMTVCIIVSDEVGAAIQADDRFEILEVE